LLSASQLSRRCLAIWEIKRSGLVLNQKARKTEGPTWNERLGNGIIDVGATLAALP
jgi:hypothetical protein